MLSRILMVAALAVPMFPRDYDDDDRDWRRNDGYYDRDDYNRRGRNYSRGGANVLNQTMRDLQSAASRNRIDGHERNHFNRAMSELQQMSYRSRQGQIDTGRLHRVLEDLDHLSRANQIHPRDRQMLARDRQALQSLAYGGGGYNRW